MRKTLYDLGVSKIKNIVFDIGNVLVGFDSKTVLKKILPESDYLDIYLKKFVLSDLWLELDKGALSIDEATKRFIKRITISQSLNKINQEQIFKELNYFCEHFVDAMYIIDQNKRLFEHVNKNYPTYILSNFQAVAFQRLTHKYAPFILEANGLVISADINMIKPNAAIYQYLLKTFKLNASETLFIDDLCENIVAATKEGIQGIVCETPKQVYADLKKYNISIPNYVQST